MGYTPDEDEMSQTEEHEFYSGLINKIGERCFSAIEKVTSECPLFGNNETVKNLSHPKTQISTCSCAKN